MSIAIVSKRKSHELKTDRAAFEGVVTFVKTHEIRKNDRNFAVGDELVLRETEHTGSEMAAGAPLTFTGRTTTRTISHIQEGYGLADDWCILSFASCMPVSTESLDYVLPEPVKLAEPNAEHRDIYDGQQVSAAFAAGRAAERAYASAFEIPGVARWRDRYALVRTAPNELIAERRKGTCMQAEIADLRAVLVARLSRESEKSRITADARRDWVNCPVCGAADMSKYTDADGHALIFCVNHGCASNGGANAAALAPTAAPLGLPIYDNMAKAYVAGGYRAPEDNSAPSTPALPSRVVAWRRATKHSWEYRNTAPTASTPGEGWMPLFDGPVGIGIRSLRRAMRAESRAVFDVWLAREYPVRDGRPTLYGKSLLELMESAWVGGADCTSELLVRDASRYGAVRERAYAFSVGNPTPDELDADVDQYLAAMQRLERTISTLGVAQ